MKVLVIDVREKRGEAIMSMGQAWRHARYVPDRLDEDIQVVFLHASEAEGQGDWRRFLENLCGDRYVVMYSGEGLRARDLFVGESRYFEAHPSHFLLQENPVTLEGVATRGWYPKEFVDAIERGERDHAKLEAILTGFDRFLEAELNFLYKCLDACHDPDPNKLPSWEVKEDTDWRTVVKELERKAGGAELNSFISAWTELSSTTAPDNNPETLRELRLGKLKNLRNALLGE